MDVRHHYSLQTLLLFSILRNGFCFLLTDETETGGVLDKDHITTSTNCGLIQGVNNSDAYSFRGIPYALAPLGDRRWRPPISLSNTTGTCWKSVFKAYHFGSQCSQRSENNNTRLSGSEDCLFLNVWTPTVNYTANLSVVVFIHGGSLQSSNGNDLVWTPTEKLAQETNIVYVSMNYRLQAFGFMTLDILSKDSTTNTSGNYGFMDQILALKWVKENIRNFGGNPDMV